MNKFNKAFGIIASAFILLINSSFVRLDRFTDFAAYLLLALSLFRLKNLSEELNGAKKSLLILSVLSGGRLAVSVIFPEITDETALLVNFTFALCTLVILLPAISKLFYGIDYLANAEGNTKAKSLSGIKLYTFIALSVKEFCSFMPYLSTLGNSYVFADGESIWTQFTNLFTLFGEIITLFFLIPLAIIICKRIVPLSKDKSFCERLSRKYEEETKAFSVKLTSERMSAVFTLFSFALAFTFSFYVDGKNIFPGFISAILFALAVLLIKEGGKFLRGVSVISSIVWAVFSCISLTLQTDFSKENYTPESAAHNIGKSAAMYAGIEIVSFVEAVFFAVTFVLFSICLWKSFKLCDCMKKSPEYLKGLKKLYIALCISVFSAFAVNASFAVFLKFFPEIWLIDALITVITVILSLKLKNKAENTLYFE